MLWSRDNLTDYVLDRMNLTIIDPEKKHEIFNQALIFALWKSKVHTLVTLLERGTGLTPLDADPFWCLHAIIHSVCYPERLSASSLPGKEASQNWQYLINDAKKTNPQFAELWRKNKLHCNLPPLHQSLHSGQIWRVSRILLQHFASLLRRRECQQLNGNSLSESLKTENLHGSLSVTTKVRMDLYRYFKSLEKDKKKKVDCAVTRSET